jgi:hypothetical protein
MMNTAALDLLQRLGEEGPRRFSDWDVSLFAAYGRTYLPAVWNRLVPGSERTFAGLSALVQQGVGEGYLKSDPEAAPLNFLEFCLRDWLPEVLTSLPAEHHLPLLARVWNLGEGLLREPQWVNDYVMSRLGELCGDRLPEEILVEVLRPLLEPAPPARWEAPYQVTLLSLRHADDEFLPGDMQLAAPTVLVVSDRRRPVRLGIHLRRKGQSVVLGTLGPTGPFPHEPAAINVAWEGGSARIGNQTVPLPFLAGPFRWTLVRAGYLVASAADSQKLWIVESAA